MTSALYIPGCKELDKRDALGHHAVKIELRGDVEAILGLGCSARRGGGGLRIAMRQESYTKGGRMVARAIQTDTYRVIQRGQLLVHKLGESLQGAPAIVRGHFAIVEQLQPAGRAQQMWRSKEKEGKTERYRVRGDKQGVWLTGERQGSKSQYSLSGRKRHTRMLSITKRECHSSHASEKHGQLRKSHRGATYVG